MTDRQLELDVDTFQKNEVRKILAEVTYTFSSKRLKYPDAQEDDFGYGMTYTVTEKTYHTYNLGLILDDETFRTVEDNLTKIQEKVTAIALNDFKHLDKLEIVNVRIFYKKQPVFDFDYLMGFE